MGRRRHRAATRHCRRSHTRDRARRQSSVLTIAARRDQRLARTRDKSAAIAAQRRTFPGTGRQRGHHHRSCRSAWPRKAIGKQREVLSVPAQDGAGFVIVDQITCLPNAINGLQQQCMRQRDRSTALGAGLLPALRGLLLSRMRHSSLNFPVTARSPSSNAPDPSRSATASAYPSTTALARPTTPAAPSAGRGDRRRQPQVGRQQQH